MTQWDRGCVLLEQTSISCCSSCFSVSFARFPPTQRFLVQKMLICEQCSWGEEAIVCQKVRQNVNCRPTVGGGETRWTVYIDQISSNLIIAVCL